MDVLRSCYFVVAALWPCCVASVSSIINKHVIGATGVVSELAVACYCQSIESQWPNLFGNGARTNAHV